ncbi:MAG TPA: hypothetical protein GXZ98_06970 [Firmicutes bacterium]|nr:hypothetical protein [Bacillota bacterium]
MEELTLTTGHQEDGVPVYYGHRRTEARLYRWEPLATKLRWSEAGEIRQKAAPREALRGGELCPGGILPVTGPLSYQGSKFIGWEARPGEPLFTKDPALLPWVEGLAFFAPLLSSYQRYHQQGLVVGCPDWRRVYRGEKGIFMPDPLLLAYLATPGRPLPAGLTACHPPEIYTGRPPDRRGDLFYLGLLLYLALTGHLPFPLVQGWPTEALRQGLIIPPTRYRPELPAPLCRYLVDLLAVDPEKRPAVEELIDQWPKLKTGTDLLNQQKKKKPCFSWEKVRIYCRLYRRRWVKNALLLGGLLFLCSWWLVKGGERSKAPFLQAERVTALLEELAAPGFPDALLPGQPELWLDLVAAKEERRTAATALLSHPVLEVKKVTLLRQEGNRGQVEVDLLWRRWQEGRWRTENTRERISVVRRGNHWIITGRQRLD